MSRYRQARAYLWGHKAKPQDWDVALQQTQHTAKLYTGYERQAAIMYSEMLREVFHKASSSSSSSSSSDAAQQQQDSYAVGTDALVPLTILWKPTREQLEGPTKGYYDCNNRELVQNSGVYWKGEYCAFFDIDTYKVQGTGELSEVGVAGNYPDGTSGTTVLWVDIHNMLKGTQQGADSKCRNEAVYIEKDGEKVSLKCDGDWPHVAIPTPDGKVQWVCLPVLMFILVVGYAPLRMRQTRWAEGHCVSITWGCVLSSGGAGSSRAVPLLQVGGQTYLGPQDCTALEAVSAAAARACVEHGQLGSLTAAAVDGAQAACRAAGLSGEVLESVAVAAAAHAQHAVSTYKKRMCIE